LVLNIGDDPFTATECHQYGMLILLRIFVRRFF